MKQNRHDPLTTLHHRWLRAELFREGHAPVYACTAVHEGSVREHDHEFVEIVLVLSGSAGHVTQDGVARIGAGDALILRPGVWHGYADARSLRIFNCCFGPELLERELAWTLDDPAVGPLLWGPRRGAVRLSLPIAPLHLAAATMGDVLAPAEWACAVGQLLGFLGRVGRVARTTLAQEGAIDPFVAAAIRRMEADLARPWRVEELSGIGPAPLTRRFTASVGLPPMAYLARCRAERAAAMLLQTDRPVAAIAADVGWPDPVYFARRFRHHYDVSPRAYRQRFGRG